MQVCCTNSFHGTVFSVIFNKKFYTVPNKSKGSRIINFCRKVGLEERIIYPDKQIERGDIIDNINYKDVNSNLEELRRVGLTYIENVLREVKHE